MNNINNNDSKSNEKKSDVKNVNSKQTKLTWKKVYQKCNHLKFSQVTNVFKKAKINSNVINLLKNYGTIILIGLIIILTILIITFWNN